MALAILQFLEAVPEGSRFRIDIGHNAYYSYAIGGTETTRQNGLEILVDPIYTSPVLGPLAPASRGRAVFDVPERNFDREHRRIQLLSFRDKARIGPAISPIVAVPSGGPSLDDLPPPEFIANARASGMRPTVRGFGHSTGTTMTAMRGVVENVPYSYQRGNGYSSAMFLEVLTSILPQILPSLGSLFSGLQKSGNVGASPPMNFLANLGNPETAKLITDLLKQISGAKSVGTALAYRDHESHAAAVHALSQYRTHFSEAKVAPALLAALPALMPIIEKVLNPDTMKAIMENVGPGKLIGTVTESIGNLAKIGMENTKQLQEHLERLNPGIKNPELYQLLESLSTGEARAGSSLKYQRSDAVKLSLADTTAQTLYGRSRLAYRYGQDLSFPVDLETPRPVAGATLELCLKEAGTLKQIFAKRYRADRASSGRLETVPAIPWSALSRLHAGEDYLLTIAFSFNGKKGGPRRGTAVSQLITLVSDYAFDRVEESSPDLVALDDESRDRDFWQRIWEQTFEDRGLTRVRITCDYCYVLEGQRTSNARMQTKSKLAPDKDSGRIEGKLKSGLILSPDALNKLIPRVSGNAEEPLADNKLEALRTPDFVDRFNQSAKTQVDFKGRRGESAALWVYPEMKMREIVLKKITGVNDNGHVEAFEEETVKFPIPAMVHFVGASSAS